MLVILIIDIYIYIRIYDSASHRTVYTSNLVAFNWEVWNKVKINFNDTSVDIIINETNEYKGYYSESVSLPYYANIISTFSANYLKNIRISDKANNLLYNFPCIYNNNGNTIRCSITGEEGIHSTRDGDGSTATYTPIDNTNAQPYINPDLKIVENNCLTLNNQYVFFYKDDLSLNISKVDFWIKFNEAPTNNTAIFTFIPKDGTNKGMYFWANSLTGMGVRIYDENGVNINNSSAGVFYPKNIATNVWYNIKLDINTNSISFNDVPYTISSGTTGSAREKTPAYIGYNPYEGARPKFSICELKMYDSNDNLLHYFPMSEGDGDIIYDAVKGNHIAGRVHYNGTVTTSGLYRGELKRDWVKALWANKQDMFAYNAINGWYEVNNQCSEKDGDIASRNIKLPNNVICSLKTDSGSNGSFFWDYGTTANNIRDYYDGYKLNLTKYQITPVLYGTIGRYSFPCIWLQNKYLNDKSDSIRFKCHYNLVCPDNLTWNFYVYLPNKAISSLSTGEGDILIEGNTSLNSHADSSSMGCYTKLYNTTQTTPSSGSTFEMTNVEVMHYDTYILSYRKPVQYGLNGCESKLQLPDGTIYDPKNTRDTQVPTVYQTGQGIYAQQNFLNYTEELSGTELVRVNNKLANLPDGRTVPQKADVNIIYPEMYATFRTTDTYMNGKLPNWRKTANADEVQDLITYPETWMYTYTGETFTNSNNDQYIRLNFGCAPTYSNGNYMKFKCDKVQFQLEDIWLQEGSDTSTKVSLSNTYYFTIQGTRKTDDGSWSNFQFNTAYNPNLQLPLNQFVDTPMDDTMAFLGYIYIQIYLPKDYTVTQNQTRLYVKGLKIDAYGFTPIDMRGHTLNSTTGVETVNDIWNQEYVIQYPNDKYYVKPEEEPIIAEYTGADFTTFYAPANPSQYVFYDEDTDIVTCKCQSTSAYFVGMNTGKARPSSIKDGDIIEFYCDDIEIYDPTNNIEGVQFFYGNPQHVNLQKGKWVSSILTNAYANTRYWLGIGSNLLPESERQDFTNSYFKIKGLKVRIRRSISGGKLS